MEIEDKALAIIENYCGESFGETQVNERINLKNNRGRLTHASATRIVAIKVRCGQWAFSSAFGATEWREIDPSELTYHGQIFVVYGGVLDGQYTESEVTYMVGHIEMPEKVKLALDLLVRQIQQSGAKSVYEMSSLITPEIAELLAPYKIHDGGGL